MTTTDSNGLIQYQTTDNVVPLQTAFNGLSSSVSTALNATVRTFKVANDTERNALATSRPPTASNPLVVFNSASGKGCHEINTGSGWSRLIPNNTEWISIYTTSGLTMVQAKASGTTLWVRAIVDGASNGWTCPNKLPVGMRPQWAESYVYTSITEGSGGNNISKMGVRADGSLWFRCYGSSARVDGVASFPL